MLIINSLIDASEYDSAYVAMHEALKAAGENSDRLGQVAGIVGGKIFKFVYDSTNKQKTIAESASESFRGSRLPTAFRAIARRRITPSS